jgi:hypothetical protein
VRQTACAISFVSNGSGAGGNALNGNASLSGTGDFSGAAIREGTVQRTGCTGTWNGATSTLTVDCGGMGTSQSCVATLVRTAAVCP